MMLISRSVLLDDVLAAVDSQVARHLFGRFTYFALRPNFTQVALFQTKLLGRAGCLRQKPGFLLRIAYPSSQSSTNFSTCAAAS
jgi:hypothetical protein